MFFLIRNIIDFFLKIHLEFAGYILKMYFKLISSLSLSITRYLIHLLIHI